jgi:GNAT superfamily N-acetyltransferase
MITLDLEITVSTDKTKLDVNFIQRFLQNESHWATNRSTETIKRSIENSLCFGAYIQDKQVGFARVVTDYSTFSWLCDVFTDPKHRGKSIGKQLVEAVVNNESLKKTGLMILATRDAHGLYSRYGGFSPIENVERFMQRKL